MSELAHGAGFDRFESEVAVSNTGPSMSMFNTLNPGVMHACGHDVHLAALVAVARTIHDVGVPTPLLVVLQPREETYPSGAKEIAEHGVLDDEQCAVMIGAHLQPALPGGVVACVAGGVNASSDEFEIIVRGESGHAAYPHVADDPLLALAEIVVALQSVVSRSVDPMRSAVVGVSSFQAGQAANVVPDVARASGTIRALASETRALLHERIVAVSENIARAHDCEAEVRITIGEPVLENDPRLVEVVSAQLTEQNMPVSTDLRSLGADDFSFFSERMPATMVFVAVCSMESTSRTGFTEMAPYRTASFMTPEITLRLVRAVGAPTRVLISEIAQSIRGVLASLRRSSPSAGCRWLTIALR